MDLSAVHEFLVAFEPKLAGKLGTAESWNTADTGKVTEICTIYNSCIGIASDEVLFPLFADGKAKLISGQIDPDSWEIWYQRFSRVNKT